MPNTAYYILIMLAAGIGVPILATLNAALGVRIGSPVAAVTVLFVVALCGAVLVLLISGDRAALSSALKAPPHLLMAGLLVMFYVLSITYVAPRFGVGNAIFFVLLGQLISAAIIDHFGLFGAQVTAFSVTRAAGIALMAAGVFVTQLVR